MRVYACSTGFSTGPSACDHCESFEPSQKSQTAHGEPRIVCVLREPVVSPSAVGSPSPQPFVASWHVAQAIRPFIEKPVSSKRRLPSTAAAGESATAFVGSAGGSKDVRRIASRRARSASDQAGVEGHAVATAQSSAARAPARVMARTR